MKAALLQRVAALKLPPNFLDQLIDSLGSPKKVAEMTGRRGRVVRDSRGHGTFQLRAKPDSSEMDSLNVKEAGALSGLCALLVDLSALFFLRTVTSGPGACKLAGNLCLALLLMIGRAIFLVLFVSHHICRDLQNYRE